MLLKMGDEVRQDRRWDGDRAPARRPTSRSGQKPHASRAGTCSTADTAMTGGADRLSSQRPVSAATSGRTAATGLERIAPKGHDTAGVEVCLSTRTHFRYRKWAVEDLRANLGAQPSPGTAQLTLWVPSVDRDSRPIDQTYWADQTLRVFGRLFGGATAFPPGLGVWRDDDRGGQLVFDDPQMVLSYVEIDVLSDPDVQAELKRHLHRLGRDANQGEVLLVVDGEPFHVTQYEELQ